MGIFRSRSILSDAVANYMKKATDAQASFQEDVIRTFFRTKVSDFHHIPIELGAIVSEQARKFMGSENSKSLQPDANRILVVIIVDQPPQNTLADFTRLRPVLDDVPSRPTPPE